MLSIYTEKSKPFLYNWNNHTILVKYKKTKDPIHNSDITKYPGIYLIKTFIKIYMKKQQNLTGRHKLWINTKPYHIPELESSV